MCAGCVGEARCEEVRQVKVNLNLYSPCGATRRLVSSLQPRNFRRPSKVSQVTKLGWSPDGSLTVTFHHQLRRGNCRLQNSNTDLEFDFILGVTKDRKLSSSHEIFMQMARFQLFWRRCYCSRIKKSNCPVTTARHYRAYSTVAPHYTIELCYPTIYLS